MEIDVTPENVRVSKIDVRICFGTDEKIRNRMKKTKHNFKQLESLICFLFPWEYVAKNIVEVPEREQSLEIF